MIVSLLNVLAATFQHFKLIAAERNLKLYLPSKCFFNAYHFNLESCIKTTLIFCEDFIYKM